MTTFSIPNEYTIAWLVNSGSTVLWAVNLEADSLSCTDIQGALMDLQAPTAYPVECDFITLSNTGAVFFMNWDTMELTTGIEVTVSSSQSVWWLNESDIEFIYTIETGFIWLILIVMCIARNLRKISHFRKTWKSI